MADFKRRLDKIGRTLGDQRDAYAPQAVLVLVFTSYWRSDGTEDHGVDSLRELREAAREATVNQITAWVSADAQRHGWRWPYSLVLTFHDEQQPQHAHFTVPWRRSGQGDLAQQVLGRLTGDDQIQWPEIPGATKE